MFEPQKLITVGLAVVLLAPFGYVFWQIATHRPRPEAQVRAELEAALRERGGEQVTPKPDGGITITSLVAVRQVEAIGFFQSTMSWLSFFPRPWVWYARLVRSGVHLRLPDCFTVLSRRHRDECQRFADAITSGRRTEMSSTRTLIGDVRPNPPAPGNGGMPSQLQAGRPGAAVPEQER